MKRFLIGALLGSSLIAEPAPSILQCEFTSAFDDCGPVVTHPETGKVTAEIRNGRAYLNEKALCPKGRVYVSVGVNGNKIFDAGIWDRDNRSRARLENVALGSLTLTLREYHGDSAFAFREHWLECSLQ